MAIVYVKTEDLSEIKRNIVKLTDEFMDEYTRLFTRLSLVTTGTQEWIGNQAYYYFDNILEDIRDFENVYNELKVLSEKLERDASEISSEIGHCIDIEALSDI